MSSPNPPNPGTSPAALSSPPQSASGGAGLTSLDYLRPITYLFENPNWLLNVVWSFLCQLVGQFIPLLPQMVLLGYEFEVLDSLLASHGTRYGDFDINRFGDYLGRSVWAVLALLLLFLVWIVPTLAVIVVGLVAVIGLAAGAGNNSGMIVVPLIFLLLVLLFCMTAILGIVATPLLLRGGLSQDFGATFNFAWIGDFLRKMWLETVLSTILVMAGATILIVITCGAAIIVLLPLLPFVHVHFLYQLYAIYLTRGGQPIPVRPLAAPLPAGAPPT